METTRPCPGCGKPLALKYFICVSCGWRGESAGRQRRVWSWPVFWQTLIVSIPFAVLFVGLKLAGSVEVLRQVTWEQAWGLPLLELGVAAVRAYIAMDE